MSVWVDDVTLGSTMRADWNTLEPLFYILDADFDQLLIDLPSIIDARILLADLNDLGDVVITTPANGHVLTYQAGQWVNQAPGGGGGGGVTGGTTTLDFGAAPGSSLAEVVITGQASIGTGSRIRAWVQGSTVDHNAYEHSRILPGRLGMGIADVVAGTGFTICAETELRLTGQVAVNWEWV